MTTFGGLEQHLAQGTNLLFFVPTCIVTIFINWKNKNIQKKVACVVSMAGIVGAIIGSIISINLDIKMLRRFFGFFLIAIAVFEFYSLIKLYIKNKKVNNKNK